MYLLRLPRVFEEKQESASTNADMKNIIYSSSEPLFMCLSAKKQSSGRGRLGRSFFSPSGGLYFSVSYPLNGDETDIPCLTLLSGIAVHKALKELYNCETVIKWPNDIYLNGKKLCGILCELVVSHGKMTAVAGIGINISLSKEEIPVELRDIMTSLAIENVSAEKEALMKQIVKNLDEYVYNQKQLYSLKDETLNKLRLLLRSFNRKVKYTLDGEVKEGFITDIQKNGAAVMKTDDGEEIIISYGEVN